MRSSACSNEDPSAGSKRRGKGLLQTANGDGSYDADEHELCVDGRMAMREVCNRARS